MEAFLAEGGGALCADDMGLGKTLQALWLLRRQRAGAMFPAVVVCPASVKYAWEYAAARHVDLRAQVLEGRTPPTAEFDLGLVPKILIINPEILKNWLPYLMRVGIQTLILDECQYYTNIRAKRTKAAILLARSVPFRLALSGTPLTNRPSELWPTLHMLRPDVYASFFSFAQQFCAPKRQPWGWDYGGAENIPELHAMLKETCMVRRLKKDVLRDLPSKTRLVVPMEVSDAREYREASSNFLQWLKTAHGTARRDKAAKAVAVTRIGYLLRLAAKLKARAVVRWANAWFEEFPEEKMVLFGVHDQMIRVLQRHIKARHVTVDGSVVGRARQLAVDTFVKDPEVRCFIGNIRAAGTGVDGLQRVCNTLAFCELWWVPAGHTQAEDRIYRIGQGNVAWINYLVAGGTIEEDLCQVIQSKQRVIQATLDGDVEVDNLDVWDQLIEIMEGKSK